MAVLSNVELVMWSPARGEEPPTVEMTRSALEARAFDRGHARDIPLSTAFRRAVKAQESETHKATIWGKETLRAQLDALIPEGERMRRETAKRWAVTNDVITGDALDVSGTSTTYTWADVSNVVQAILKTDGLGAYSPRRAGGIYFVPLVGGKDLLDRLERCTSAVGLNLLRYQIPDTDAQRSEVSDALADGLLSELREHEDAIALYGETTRGGIVENRREALSATLRLIHSLELFLAGRSAELRERVSALDTRCEEVLLAIRAYTPPARGRRIQYAQATS